ncbi:DUF2637 domain-containing protein [Nonomuraea maritima]|uniref:DUF2637 domain-containing protein n=1 Tax=Nonomuraea maritima TaxID=683260 RepID=UPI00371446B5
MTPPSTLRRLGIALAGLAVAALAGAACALSFDDLRALALTGEARQDLAFLYPAAFDALLVVALLGVLLLRAARPLVRTQAALVLVLLLAAAAAADVASAVRFVFDARQTAIGVALAPWVMLALALWVWLLLIKHVQAGRAAARGGDDDGDTPERDIVPFDGERAGASAQAAPPVTSGVTEPLSSPVTEWPARPEPGSIPAPRPAADTEPPDTATPRTDPAPSDPHGQPDPEPAQDTQERHEPEPAYDPEFDEGPAVVILPKAPDPVPAYDPEPDEGPAVVILPKAPDPVTAQEGEGQPEEPETRPVRWGDRVKPADVLVHPRPSERDDDRDADTQPHPIVEDNTPDPLHGPEAADAAEPRPRVWRDDATGHPAVDDDTPAPSGRLRSTPRPPED